MGQKIHVLDYDDLRLVIPDHKLRERLVWLPERLPVPEIRLPGLVQPRGHDLAVPPKVEGASSRIGAWSQCDSA